MNKETEITIIDCANQSELAKRIIEGAFKNKCKIVIMDLEMGAEEIKQKMKHLIINVERREPLPDLIMKRQKEYKHPKYNKRDIYKRIIK